MTDDDKHDLWLLGLANEKGKFALEYALELSQPQQDAFERGIDNDWFTLVDISPVEAAPDFKGGLRRSMRVFKLTALGTHRIAKLNFMAAE